MLTQYAECRGAIRAAGLVFKRNCFGGVRAEQLWRPAGGYSWRIAPSEGLRLPGALKERNQDMGCMQCLWPLSTGRRGPPMRQNGRLAYRVLAIGGIGGSEPAPPRGFIGRYNTVNQGYFSSPRWRARRSHCASARGGMAADGPEPACRLTLLCFTELNERIRSAHFDLDNSLSASSTRS